MSTEARLAELERWQMQVQRDLNRLPLYLPPAPIQQMLHIIGGQLSNGINVIKYVADDPTLTALYDPDVDTTYPDGMGNAWLVSGGNRIRRVLVRHDFSGDTDYSFGASPDGGWLYEVRGTRVLTVASGADMGKTMLCYLIGLVL